MHQLMVKKGKTKIQTASCQFQLTSSYHSTAVHPLNPQKTSFFYFVVKYHSCKTSNPFIFTLQRVSIYLFYNHPQNVTCQYPSFRHGRMRLKWWGCERGDGVVVGVPRKIGLQLYQMIQRLDCKEYNNFERLVEQLSQRNLYQAALQQANQRYFIRSYKISDFNPLKVAHLYATLQQKFYLRRTKPNEDSWFQNQLRIYIWLLVGYLYISDKTLERMVQSDWQYFVPIFNHRSYTFFEYQSISLLRHTHKLPKWLPEEAALLEQIIVFKNFKNKWNSIARELYNRSNKKYYRNPKQCREQWMNHLDPRKLHSEWTEEEDLTLLTTVRASGKKWSQVVKKLLNTRTEHMVKNRYKSLISNELKRQPHLRHGQVETALIRKLQGGNSGSRIEAKVQNVLPEASQQERQGEQQVKSQRQPSRKCSNMSEDGLGFAESLPMIQLSDSQYLNSPLPIPRPQNLDQSEW